MRLPTSTAFVQRISIFSVQRPINSKLDIVPIVPPRLLGFVHPSNEKHIVTSGLDAGDWYACAGQDNTSKDCSQGAVPLIIDGQTADHLGPYGTVMLGIGSCSD